MNRNPFKNYEEAKEIYDLCNYEIDTRADINSTAMKVAKESIKYALIVIGAAVLGVLIIGIIPFEALKNVLAVILVVALIIAYYGFVLYYNLIRPLGGFSSLKALWPDTSGVPDGVKDAVSSVSVVVMSYVLESVPGGFLVVLLFKPLIFFMLVDAVIMFPPVLSFAVIHKNNKEIDSIHQIKGIADQAMRQFASGQAPAGAIPQGEMRCPNCSRLLKPGQSFCTKCGTRL